MDSASVWTDYNLNITLSVGMCEYNLKPEFSASTPKSCKGERKENKKTMNDLLSKIEKRVMWSDARATQYLSLDVRFN